MRENGKDSFGRKRRFGVMDTFVARLATQARKPSASTLRVKGEDGVSSTKLKDFVDETPTTDKKRGKETMGMESDQKQSSGKVKVGDRAPDFTLEDQAGKEVHFSELLGEKNIVLYFYPKDESPGCTAEACSFRDNYAVFKDQGAEVVGISSDSAASHQQFATKHRLPYILLSDVNGSVRKLYGVSTTFGLLPGRVTYVIDKQGIVHHVFSAQFTPEKHITEALRTLQNLDKERV